MATATANPALSTDVFTEARRDTMDNWRGGRTLAGAEAMTLNGTVGKASFLLTLIVVGGAYTWSLFLRSGEGAVLPWMLTGIFGSLVAALVTIFKRTAAPITAPVYALLEGLALGGITALFQASYPGIALAAVGISVSTLAAMLLLYVLRIIRPTNKFVFGVGTATLGVGLFYLLTLVLGAFHLPVPLIFSYGPAGIAFSAFVLVLSALNLIIDFGVIESGIEMRAPKYMEWYGAFGLMVTLVWLYLEALRLVAKLRANERSW